MTFSKSPLCGYLLSLLMPGLGHGYFREYIFGFFVYLVTLMAVVLFIVSFFLDLPLWAMFLITGLPIVFYLFTFVDLHRTAIGQQAKDHRGRKAVWIFIIIGVVYQALAPVAPGNFVARNFPTYFIQPNNRLAPIYAEGDLLKASRLAYTVDIFFIRKPLLHALPGRYDIVRFNTPSGQQTCGLVIGLPNEEIQAVDGVVIINDMPDFHSPPEGIILQGDCPLTYVDGYSILVAVLNLGYIDTVYEVSLDEVAGKVGTAF